MKESRTSILGVIIALAALVVGILDYLAPFSPIGRSPFASDSVEPTLSLTTNAPILSAEQAVGPNDETVTTAISQAGDVRTVSRGVVEAVQVFVPAGSFIMGSEDGSDDENLEHKVKLDAFWIDRTEVTNAQFAKCVDDGICQPPSDTSSYTRDDYYGNSTYANHPVIYVSWSDARDFCTWAGGRLPTEAEWEYAARGPEGFTYPWGHQDISCDFANYRGKDDICVGDTSIVGDYADGASWIGALDMAGNVWEWVNDWYDGLYYGKSPDENPRGPVSGEYRVLRGGAWNSRDDGVRSFSRYDIRPDVRNLIMGFRCAQE